VYVTRIRAVLAVLAAGLTAILLVAVGSAGAASNATGAARFEEFGDGSVGSVQWTPLGVSGAQQTLVVQLKDDPVALVQANQGRKLSPDEKKAVKDQLKGKQDALAGAISGLGGTVLADYQFAYNGIKVRIDPRKADDLAKLPGVVGVRTLQTMTRDNVRGVPLIGAPAVWDGLAGRHGEGVKIVVIDTGIDYTHANFGGPGTIAAYQAANAADTAPANPAWFGPAAPRVKGGTDLVGDAYNADGNAAAQVPHPDPNPLDCNGHGSHVAGTAGGSGVLANGSTYTGPYNASTISGNQWTVGPGVAPKADLYSVRVFGCAGSTNVTVDAIEWAVANDMDVINMSLGSPFGSKDDPSAVASTNAAKAGVIVVTSAGNNGPSQYITGSPGTAEGAIATAANDPWQATPGVRVVTAPGGLSLTAINSNGFNYTAPITGPLVILKDNPATTVDAPGLLGSANEALGCSPDAYTFNGVVPNGGQITVAQRGACARVAKAIFAQQAGARAAVMTNNAAGLPPFEGVITSNPDTGAPFTVTIPFVGIAGNQATPTTDSGRLLASPAGSTATLSPIDLANANYTGFASFSSGGGRTGDSALKPDITAPGVSIASTANGTGNGMAIISGTSMASPHTAGVAALVRQAHPSWSVSDVKAAIVNTGEPSLVGGATPLRVSRGGTGLVQPARAIATDVIAYSNGGSKFDVALSYGFEELKNDYSKSKAIKLDNLGSSPATFTIAAGLPQGNPHSVALSASSVTVPAGGSASVEVTVNVAAATVGRSNDGGLSYQEVAGLITFTPTAGSNNGVALRVPYYLVPRAQSDVSTAIQGKLSPGASVTAVVSNKAGAPVAGDGDFYAWGLEDKKDKGNAQNDVRAVGIQSFAAGTTAVPTRRVLIFAVNTFDRWSNASSNEFDIYVDVNGDGSDDYIVVGADQGAVQTGTSNGRMGAFVFSTRSAGAAINFLATDPTDSTTVLIPVFSTALCRANEPCLNSATAPGARIRYHAVSFDLIGSASPDEVDGNALYNPWNEAITTGGFADSVAPGSSANVPVSINATEWAVTPAKGLMVVTLDNKAGPDEAQLIDVKK
jgi:minor extracellular serine protease Vpr